MFPYEGYGGSSAAFVAGVALHLLVFRVSEWDLWAKRLIIFFLAIDAAATIAALLWMPGPHFTVGAAVSEGTQLTALLILGLTVSMLVYRAFFHRLRSFPGPFAARLSNWYITSLISKKLQQYVEVHQLHSKYGDFVRVGPTELSIIHPEAAAAIHSTSSPCSKGPWYAGIPRKSIQSTRDKAHHQRRRRVWDQGFSAKALREYEPRIAFHVGRLLGRVEESAASQKPLEVTNYMNFFAFDMMGELAFGKGFEMLRDGRPNFFLETFHEQARGVGLGGHAIWLGPVVQSLPSVQAEMRKFWDWVGTQVTERRKVCRLLRFLAVRKEHSLSSERSWNWSLICLFLLQMTRQDPCIPTSLDTFSRMLSQVLLKMTRLTWKPKRR